ncbi:hypothetical protein RF11_12499 [Thelohanellus kitauei]|uniref:Uncharacterized protein n=1 Tax=Thelohanellus kitauei TaxID=669202 RepID=A0A0C2NGR1_THEKT|nr:hypothetical protein RF11_12499 [Thelohanellus kitauei]
MSYWNKAANNVNLTAFKPIFATPTVIKLEPKMLEMCEVLHKDCWKESLITLPPPSYGSRPSIEQIFKAFLISIREQEAALVNLKEKLALPKKIKEYFQTCSDIVETIPHIVYKKVCSIIIQSSINCVLKMIIEKLVLPSKPGIDFPVDHLQSIIVAFTELDFENDEYIRRKLVQIFNRYFINNIKILSALLLITLYLAGRNQLENHRVELREYCNMFSELGCVIVDKFFKKNNSALNVIVYTFLLIFIIYSYRYPVR